MCLRIGVDLDGVLADLDSALQVLERRILGARDKDPHAPASDDAETTEQRSPPSGQTSHERDRVWREVRHTADFWITLRPIDPSAIARLYDLSIQWGWDVFFLTKRPWTRGDTVRRQTHRWLVEHGFDLPTVIVHRGSRDPLATALGLDFLVDDTVVNCVNAVVESKVKAILVHRGDDPVITTNAKRLGITVCRTLAESLAYLERVSETRVHPPLLRRVARHAGLR